MPCHSGISAHGSSLTWGKHGRVLACNKVLRRLLSCPVINLYTH